MSCLKSQAMVCYGKWRFYWKILLVILAILIPMVLGLWYPLSAGGQGADTLIVLPPDSANFPILSTQIKPKLIPGVGTVDLQSEDLTVMENGQVVPLLELEKQRGGVHFTLVINGDRRLDVRDANGESPYDRIRAALTSWVDGRRFSPGDTFSLVAQEGALIRNTIDRDAWGAALENYQPNLRTMVPDLVSLETALRLTEERVVPFGVDKALLYITPPPTVEEIIPLAALTEAARAAEIQVHVWMLGEDFFLNNDQGGALINLAAVTGGQFFHYTGVNALPDPESYLDGMGIYYDLRFTSGIRQAGTYTLTVETADGELRGESGTFYLDVQPPKPILLSPPSIITRTAPQGWEGDAEQLTPSSISIDFLLEFPDDHPRDLVSSRLTIDGRVVDERTEPPFDSLTWDLTAQVEPGEYSLQVKVTDSLGLSGETIITPVQVALILPEPETPVSYQTFGLILVGALLAAAVLILTIWSVRRLLRAAFAQRLLKKVFEFQRKPAVDNTTLVDQRGKHLATLLPLALPDANWEQSAIRITKPYTTFGSDPDRADQLLEGEDLDGLQARLRWVEDNFWLSDCGSAGGTWINYDLIGSEPVQLNPGDLIHFSSLGFRFTIIDVESPLSPSVEKYDLK